MVQSLDKYMQATYKRVPDDQDEASGQNTASAELALLVQGLFDMLGSPQEATCVIELCSRYFELSRYMNMPDHDFYAVDLEKPKKADKPDETNEPQDDYVPQDNYVLVEGNLFAPKTLKALTAKDGAHLIYCRPPAQKAISKSDDLVEGAEKLVRPYLVKRAQRLREEYPDFDFELDMAPAPSLLEWYYVYAAAALIDEQPGSVAVMQVPLRALELARAGRDRRLLLNLGLVDSVVLLPSSIARNASETVLLCLTDGEPQRPVFIYDARDLDNAPMKIEAIDQLVENLAQAHGEERREGACWVNPLEQDATLCSLMPQEKPGIFPSDCYVPFSRLSVINRGIPRSTIEGLEENAQIDPDRPPELHYYLSLKTFTDGQVVGLGAIADLADHSPEDTYDLRLVDQDSRKGVKCLDTKVANLLIARASAPFKLALVLGSAQPNPRNSAAQNNPADDEVPTYYYEDAFTFDPEDSDPQNISDDDYRAYYFEEAHTYDPTIVPPDDSFNDAEEVEQEMGAFDLRIIPSDNLFYVPVEDELYARFLLAYFSSQEGQDKLKQITRGAALPQISLKDLRAMNVPVPSQETQLQVAEAYAKKQAAYEQALAQVERLAQSKLYLG